eukprot:1159201-Pelagomonas_calceolata.AAC.7
MQPSSSLLISAHARRDTSHARMLVCVHVYACVCVCARAHAQEEAQHTLNLVTDLHAKAGSHKGPA